MPEVIPDMTWIAIYKDGTALRECNLEGVNQKYKDIGRKQLVRFNLYSATTYETIRTYYLLKNEVDLEKAIVPEREPLRSLIDSALERYYQNISIFANHSISYLKTLQRPKEPPSFDLVYPKQLMKLESNFFITVDFSDKKKRLIWRKRRHQKVGKRIPFKTVYLLGWQKTVKGKNVQSIVYIYPNNRIELSDSQSDLELLDFE